MSALPQADTEPAFDGVVRDEAALRPGVDALCRSEGVDPQVLVRFPTGSLPVYAAGDLVLKLFPPVYAAEQPVEEGVLRAVEGRLPVTTPAVRSAGERDGWRWVLMDRLPGTDLGLLWPELDRAERRRLAGQAGGAAAALHRVPAPELGDWGPASWPGFVAEQRDSAVERHRRRGLPEPWLAQVDGFLAGVDLGPDDERVLLHTELMPANLLAARDAAGDWSLSGLCDFEPAMRGSREYELVAVGVFLGEGDPVVLREALSSYGYAPAQLDADLARRLMAWTLLHCYGDVAAYLQRLPLPAAPTLDALAQRWFGAYA